jgi:hypothetical protein
MDMNRFSLSFISNCIQFHWQTVINMKVAKNNNIVLLIVGEVSAFWNSLITQVISDILIDHTFAYESAQFFRHSWC